MKTVTERRVDELWRVVIPREIREKYKILQGDAVRIVEETDGFFIEPVTTLCRLCGARLPDEGEYLLCDACLDGIRREVRTAPKIVPLSFRQTEENEK